MCSNSSYRDKIRRASAIFLSEKHPAERAADMLEHVLKFGDEHLRPAEAFTLSLWEFYMLDVVAIIYTLILIIAIVSFKVASFFVRALCRRLVRTK